MTLLYSTFYFCTLFTHLWLVVCSIPVVILVFSGAGADAAAPVLADDDGGNGLWSSLKTQRNRVCH